jgi:hypothetical protein
MITFLITVGGMFVGWLVAYWLAGRSEFWTTITGIAAGATWGIARLVELEPAPAILAGITLAVLLVLRGLRVRNAS